MNTTLLLTLLVQVILPLVVGLVTKKSTNANTKFIVLAVLTALNTGALGYLAGTSLADLLLTGGIGLLTSVGTHYGFYKPLGAAEVVQNTLVKDKPVVEVPEEEPVVEEEVAPEAEEPTETGTDAEEVSSDEAEQETEVLAVDAEVPRQE